MVLADDEGLSRSESGNISESKTQAVIAVAPSLESPSAVVFHGPGAKSTTQPWLQ
jgi:hypothetical protein